MANVLVVDDEEVYRTYLASWLTRDGHSVESASNAREAVELAKEFRPDVLIVDWMLKNEFYGLQIVEAIENLAPGLKTILITGFPSESLRREALNARIFRFIEKPFHMSELAAAVREAHAAKLGSASD